MLQAKLVELGAVMKFKSPIREVAFTHPVLRIREKGILLRLRTVADRIELTLKKRNMEKKILARDEAEIDVSNFRETIEILGALGFIVCRDREKRRVEWEWRGFKIEIDTYPGCPPYVEIEGSSYRAILRAIKALGLGECERFAGSSTDLLRRWGAKNYDFLKF